MAQAILDGQQFQQRELGELVGQTSFLVFVSRLVLRAQRFITYTYQCPIYAAQALYSRPVPDKCIRPVEPGLFEHQSYEFSELFASKVPILDCYSYKASLMGDWWWPIYEIPVDSFCSAFEHMEDVHIRAKG